MLNLGTLTDLITRRSVREFGRVDLTFAYRVSNIVSFERRL